MKVLPTWLYGVVIDGATVSLFYLSLRTAEQISFIDTWLRPYWWLVVLVAFTTFFFVWFRSVLTDTAVATLMKRGLDLAYTKRRRAWRAALHVTLFCLGFLQFIVYLTLLVGSAAFHENTTAFPTWAGVVLAAWLAGATIIFAVLLGYFHLGDDDTTPQDMTRRQQRLTRLWHTRPNLGAALYGVSATVMPVYTLWMFCGRLANSHYAPPPHATPFRHTRTLLGLALSVVVLVILDTEVTAATSTGGLATLPARVALVYLGVFLPFRVLLATQNQNGRSFGADLLTGAGFFAIQLLILSVALY